MKETLSWKTLGPLGLGMLALLALATSCAGITGGGGGGTPIPPQPVSGYIPNTITVSGYGEATGTPDVAYVQLGVNIVNPDVGRAVAQANETMDAVQDAMRQFQIANEDMQTVSYSVWPEDRYDPQTGQPTGERVYHVDSMLSIKVRDLEATGDIIQAGLDAGANTVAGLSFGVEDTDALQAEARTNATNDARARAQQMANALGVTLGAPILVTEGYGYTPPVVFATPRMDFGGGGGAPPISPGQTTIGISVTVVFSIGE